MRFLKTQTDSGKLDKQNPQQIKPEGVEATRQSQAKDRSVDEHAYTHTYTYTQSRFLFLLGNITPVKKAAHVEIMRRVTIFISLHCQSLFSLTEVDSLFWSNTFFFFVNNRSIG